MSRAQKEYIDFSLKILTDFSAKAQPEVLLELISEKICNKNSSLFFKKLDKLKFKGVNNAEFSKSVITAENNSDDFSEFDSLIHSLMPWRKGPFKFNSLFLDSEWQCQLKWDRLSKKTVFKNKTVLDVGSGNGYYLYRLLGAGAKFGLGLDPHLLYFHQNLALNAFFQPSKLHLMPLGWESCDKFRPVFDVVMCMGVLYHQKDPELLLSYLKTPLKKSGELLLETLIINSNTDTMLIPESRYAAMKNVYNIPSKKRLIKWLLSTGYRNIEILDITQTQTVEQRETSFSSGMSLIDFLDPKDLSKTIEGHPRPLRILLKASI